MGLYFKQPQNKYTLDEILQSKKIIIASDSIPDFTWKQSILNANLPLSEDDFLYWKKLYDQCPLADDIIRYAEFIKSELFPKNQKILAISHRRSFEWHHYVRSEFVLAGSHLIRGTLQSVLYEIESKLKEYNYEYFFFTSDDRESYTAVQEKFGDKCLFTNRPIGHFFKNGKSLPKDDAASHCVEFNKHEKDVYLRAKEYLADMYLLSQCDSFLSCGSSADFLAYIINDKKYEHFFQIKGEGDTHTHENR